MNVPFNDPEGLEVHIARQLPVISQQRDSLAVVLLTRWMRLAATHGTVRLAVSRHRHQERWLLGWQTPGGHTQELEAPTLAELLVRVRTERPPGAPRHRMSHGGRSREPVSP
jgi:hypothetical protein